MLDLSHPADASLLATTPARARHAGVLDCIPARSSGAIAPRARAAPGVYPQCVPDNGDAPHLLGWLDEPARPGTARRPQVLTADRDGCPHGRRQRHDRAESAAKRFKSSETVKTQRRSILLKLGARNMAQAVGMMHSAS